LLIYFEELD